MVKRKAKPKEILLSNLGTRALTMYRTLGRIEEIQKKDPSFNYKENWRLARSIDSMLDAIDKIKSLNIRDPK